MTEGSETPLVKKLGIKEGTRLGVVNQPDHFLDLLGPLPSGCRLYEDRATEPLHLLVYFTDARESAANRVPYFARLIDRAGGLWVAYPKKSSPIETDLTFDYVQRLGLGAGLVDNKSCAIDDDWTAVRFVYRKEDR